LTCVLMSHPLRVRGLKLKRDVINYIK